MSVHSIINQCIYITTCHSNRHFLTLQCPVNNVLDFKWFRINGVVVSLLAWLAMKHQQDICNHIAVIKHANVMSILFPFKHGGRWYVVFDKNLACFFDWYISITTPLSIHVLMKDIAHCPYISITFWLWIKLDAGTMVQSAELVVIPSLCAIGFMLCCYCLSKKRRKRRFALKINWRPVGGRNRLTFALQSAPIGSLVMGSLFINFREENSLAFCLCANFITTDISWLLSYSQSLNIQLISWRSMYLQLVCLLLLCNTQLRITSLY